MHPHKAKSIVDTIDKFLPSRYISEVIKRAKKKKLNASTQYVRDVKRFKTRNPEILAIIIDIAKENEKAIKKLEKMADKDKS